jgi:dihydroflavonol-4-reductase
MTRTKPQFTPYSIETIQSNAVISHKKATIELGYAPRTLYDSLTDTVLWLLEYRKLAAKTIRK